MALVSLVVYYLLAFLGEQLARVGTLSVFGGAVIPILATIAFVFWLYAAPRLEILNRPAEAIREFLARLNVKRGDLQFGNLFIDLTTGLRDLDLLVNLTKYFFLTLGFLGILSMIFTAFELWKFAGTMPGGTFLLLKYLIFLTPFLYLQYLAPTAAMLAILATYIIKSRQNEIVTWISAGQSVYRLLAPCFIAMAILGFVNWEIQERILPTANQIQDSLRTQIRSRGVVATKGGRYWIYTNDQIISFEIPFASDNDKTTTSMPNLSIGASDNEQNLSKVRIFQFATGGAKLQAVYQATSAAWKGNRLVLNEPINKSDLKGGQILSSQVPRTELSEESDPFVTISEKPSYLDRAELRERVRESDSDTERRIFSVALQKRFATPFLPLIIALFTAPFALSLNRRGKVTTVGIAVGLWLFFVGFTSVFEEFGLNGFLTPSFAIWAPLSIFTMLGIYLLSRVKT